MSALTALFGGTFDPIHIGHLRAALETSLALNTEVRMLPAQIPPHRPQPVASAAHRMAMLQLALRGQPRLLADDCELRRPGPSYTMDTLLEFRAQLGKSAPLALIVGADAFAGLPSWNRWQNLFDLAHIVVLNRPGTAMADAWPEVLRKEVAPRQTNLPDQLHKAPCGQVLTLEIAPLAISATAIRDTFAHGRLPHWLVPEEVLAYIQAHGLYR